MFSRDDEPGAPSRTLIDLALRLIDRARSADLSAVSNRLRPGLIRYPDIWPGEHYHLLAAAVELLQPRTVIEIGTAQGLSALALKQALPADGRVVTFDICPWQDVPDAVLTDADFADGRLVQHIDDLSVPEVFRRHADLLRLADLVFMDAAKDGWLEATLLAHFDGLAFAGRPLFILDDIRLWNMLRIWREVRRPKLDLTSFGHWSGTGLIEWDTRIVY